MGNTGDPSSVFVQDFLADCSKKYKRTFVVIGPEDISNGDILSKITMFHTITKSLENVHIVGPNSAHIIDNAFTIVGSTLWSPFYNSNEHKVLFRNSTMTTKEREYRVEQIANNDLKTLNTHIETLTTKPIIVLSYSLCTSDILGRYLLYSTNKHYVSNCNINKYKNIKSWLCGASPSSTSGCVFQNEGLFIGVNNFNASNYGDDRFVEISNSMNNSINNKTYGLVPLK